MASAAVRWREGLVAAGDLGIALRPQVPDGGRVLDQEGESVPFELGQKAGGVGADGVAHAGIEAVVDVREHQVQAGPAAAVVSISAIH